MFRLDSLALVSMGSFALLWAITVAAAPRRDREGSKLVELITLLAGTMLAYAAAEIPVFLVGWAVTVAARPSLALVLGTAPLAIGAVLMFVPDHAPAAFAAFVLAVLLRKGIFPFHSSTVNAFEHLPLPALSLLLNGHLGGYLFIRFVIPEFPVLAAQWMPAVGPLALVTSVLMAVAALAETRARRVLGLLWLSQGAFILAGLATLTLEGTIGALMQWWVVAFAMTGLTSVYRSLEVRTSAVREQTGFHGLGAHAPRLAVFFAVCGLALVGLPGTLGFVAEDLLFHGALKAHSVLGVALPLATALNAITVLRLFVTLFMGRRAIHVSPIPDALPAERIAFTVVVMLLVLGGLAPSLLIALRTP